MGRWHTCVSCMLYTSSMMILVVAVILMGLCIWTMNDQHTFLVPFAEEQQQQQEEHRNFNVTLFFALALASIMILCVVLAFLGARKKSACLLMVAFSIIFVSIVWQLSIGVWVTLNSNELSDVLKSNMINTIKNEYGVIESRTQMVDTFQYELECCGANGPADWAGSKYANKNPSLPFNLTVSSGVTSMYNVPKSCCKTSDSNVCNDTREVKIGGIVNFTIIHNEGCTDKLAIELEKQTHIIGIISIGVGLMQFLFAVSVIMLTKIIWKERYKA